jgi:hypothetical protein
MNKTLERTITLKNGHEMTESSLNGMIKTMQNRLVQTGVAATGIINLPESDMLFNFAHYDAYKVRHALYDYRYKIANVNGSLISINLY